MFLRGKNGSSMHSGGRPISPEKEDTPRNNQVLTFLGEGKIFYRRKGERWNVPDHTRKGDKIFILGGGGEPGILCPEGDCLLQHAVPGRS